MPRFSRRKTGNRSYIEISFNDIKAIIDQLGPSVDEALEPIAKKVANAAKRSTAFKDSNKSTDVKRNLDFWPDEWFPHKHLRPAIDVKKSKFPLGGWIVRANRPHGHLVEYGHYLVTPDGRTIGFVPPHAFLRPAKEEVMAGLGRMEL
jgi:hypothetical protein